MNALVLIAIVALGFTLLSSGKGGGKALGPGKKSLSDVVVDRPDGTVKFTRETAVGLWRTLKSHGYAVDKAVPGRVQVAPETSGHPLAKGDAATDWAIDQNVAHGLYLLAPIYLAFDGIKGARYLRALPEADAKALAKKPADKSKEPVYAILADPGEAADLAKEAEAPVTNVTNPPGTILSSAGEGKPPGGIPSGAGAGKTTTYDLTAADVETGPLPFATRAGYASVDDFVKDNPAIARVDPPDAGWPPVVGQFYYTDRSTGVGNVYVPTGRIDVATKRPTYTQQGDTASPPAEYAMPSWNLVSAAAGNYAGPPPIASDSSVGKIYGVPSTIDPSVFNFHALVPWFVGQTVNVQAAHPLLTI